MLQGLLGQPNVATVSIGLQFDCKNEPLTWSRQQYVESSGLFNVLGFRGRLGGLNIFGSSLETPIRKVIVNKFQIPETMFSFGKMRMPACKLYLLFTHVLFLVMCFLPVRTLRGRGRKTEQEEFGNVEQGHKSIEG